MGRNIGDHKLNKSRGCASGRRSGHDDTNHRSLKTSGSPGSSSASDSAFSQSQTTLGSESEHSTANCFRESLRSEEKPNRRRYSSDSNLFGPELEGDHFKIVWRNLSYKIPEKKFARSLSWLKRKREALWPTTIDLGNDEVDQIAPHQLDEQPVKPPLIGKARDVIFSNLNGCVKSGQLTAILGPSGAGKTTFLKCLTNSISKGVSGSIDITGGGASSHHLKLCIIPQKDYLFDNLTVMENLIFASKIKNPNKANVIFDHLDNVQRVADLLGLQACLKLKTSRLSGGQYKRVSIAQELLSKPDILILDEPTSGLDSLTCFRTISVLRDLVNKSRAGLMPPLAIIMTIHQPQIKIFNIFHHVYVLSSMGKCVYEGRPEYLMDTVADCCKLIPPPDDLNPASFIINLASEVYGVDPVDQLTKLQRENFDLLHNDFHQHHQHQLQLQLQHQHHHHHHQVGSTGPMLNKNLVHYIDSNDKNITKKILSATTKQQQVQVAKGCQVAVEISSNLNKPKLEADDSSGGSKFRISARLRKRNSQTGSFWAHTWLLMKRLWISMWRDPLLTTTRVTFHLVVPFVFYFIYSQKSGAANACPYVDREIDFQSMASEATVKRLTQQHDELILTFENVSLFFLLLYSFSMCVLAVTALSFPLNMQILLKETSNGWYSMPRFVMAKTLADLPIELAMPMTSVAIAYVLTGQPSSYLCWRMLTVTAVMTLCSLISQTQGLLFGAYFMNNVQAAVFVSQASSLPWILLSGFTTRVSELPRVLQWLSFGSIYRLGIESIVAVRYGFGMCPCDEELVNDTPVKMVGVPSQLRSVMRYYLDTYADTTTVAPLMIGTTDNQTAPTSGGSSNKAPDDIFETIATTLSRANTFGVDIANCHDVRPFILSAREVDEKTLPAFFLILVIIFVVLKLLLFWVVRLRAS